MIKDYFSLTKGGLVLGNLVTVLGAFLLGAKGRVDVALFAATIVGISFVMASGCVFNNYIDRDIDGLMERTKGRALILGRISGRSALVFGGVLGLFGFLILGFYVNFLALIAAFFGSFFYVFMYSLWFKRRTVHGTIVGSVSGAVPPVVGYVAATGRFDLAAVILFAIMIVWQMPHFYAIGIRRADEYAAASVPVLPVVSGVRATKMQMLFYIAVFIIVAPLLAVFGYAGKIYFAIAIILGCAWFALCLRGFRVSRGDGPDTANVRWAREIFLFSLIVLMVLFVAIAIGV